MLINKKKRAKMCKGTKGYPPRGAGACTRQNGDRGPPLPFLTEGDCRLVWSATATRQATAGPGAGGGGVRGAIAVAGSGGGSKWPRDRRAPQILCSSLSNPGPRRCVRDAPVTTHLYCMFQVWAVLVVVVTNNFIWSCQLI